MRKKVMKMDWEKIVKNLLKPRTIFAFMFYGVLCYLIFRQFPIPEILKNIVMSLMGFYFGQRVKKGAKDENLA